MSDKVAMAISAHPDDIEFCMAGTMLLLSAADYELHYLTIANGGCGGTKHDAATVAWTRAAEAKQSAKILRCNLSSQLLQRSRDRLRGKPFTPVGGDHSGSETEHHSYPSARRLHGGSYLHLPIGGDCCFCARNAELCHRTCAGTLLRRVTLYHATPHGLTDPFGRLMVPELFVNTEGVHQQKRQALAAHESQAAWLGTSQGASSLIAMLDAFSSKVGELSGHFRHAEGWWRHSHLGFCREDADPIRTALGTLVITRKDH